MIAGIGTDITDVRRFKKWVKNPLMIERFFNEQERKYNGTEAARCQHYAVRFAAKEAFSKALGTGLSGFGLKDVFITNNSEGKPTLNIVNSALSVLKEKLGDCNVFVSLSHEKEYAVATVILEKNS